MVSRTVRLLGSREKDLTLNFVFPSNLRNLCIRRVQRLSFAIVCRGLGSLAEPEVIVSDNSSSDKKKIKRGLRRLFVTFSARRASSDNVGLQAYIKPRFALGTVELPHRLPMMTDAVGYVTARLRLRGPPAFGRCTRFAPSPRSLPYGPVNNWQLPEESFAGTIHPRVYAKGVSPASIGDAAL